jgi:hypothetical protein
MIIKVLIGIGVSLAAIAGVELRREAREQQAQADEVRIQQAIKASRQQTHDALWGTKPMTYPRLP